MQLALTAPRLAVFLLPVVLTLGVLPLLAVAIPPLHDYPFHLARADAVASLLGQVGHGTVYRLGSFLLPNEAMDVVTMGLTAAMPPMLAGRVFLGLVQVLLLGGVVALHWALHRRLSPWPLVGGFLLYNWIFLYGFTNYLFGVAAMLWGVAAWVALARAPAAVRMALGAATGVVVMFSHLVAFGLYAVVLGGLALHDALEEPRGGWGRVLGHLLVPAVPLAVTLALFVALSPTAGEVRQPIAWQSWLGWKPLMAWRTLQSGHPWLDLLTLGPVAALGLGLLALRRLVLSPAMLAPLMLLGVTYLVMPYSLFGSLYGDARLPVAIALVAVAGFDIARLAPRHVALGAALLVLLLAGRNVAIARDWRATAPVFDSHMHAFDLLPQGSRLWAATAGPYPRIAWSGAAELAMWHPPLKHVASLASVGRDVFVPSTWADPFKQPIVLPPEHMPAKQVQGDNPLRTATGEELEQALRAIRRIRVAGGPPDFLLLSYPARLQGALPAGLERVAEGPEFLLMRIE
jgi:hypothetical protein